MNIRRFGRTFKNKAVDTMSNVLSAPARMNANSMTKKANRVVDTARVARKYKDVPDFDYKGNPQKEAITARGNYENAKIKFKKKLKRYMK